MEGSILALSPKEFDLLLFLVKNKGKMVTRELVLEKVWGWEYIGNSRSVDVHIRWLREKIEVDPKKPNRIITVRGGGYIFEG
jgi:DNA-binding response OmpR family regulator